VVAGIRKRANEEYRVRAFLRLSRARLPAASFRMLLAW
jgi:hypothetical protein